MLHPAITLNAQITAFLKIPTNENKTFLCSLEVGGGGEGGGMYIVYTSLAPSRKSFEDFLKL